MAGGNMLMNDAPIERAKNALLRQDSL